MRSIVLSFMLLVAVVSPDGDQKQAPQGTAPDNTEHKGLGHWMDAKVEESQKIFAALARSDFDSIKKSTKKMKTLSSLEGFVRRSTPGYRTQLRSFEFAVSEIRLQANRKNIEGVALGFHQLTLSCVNCHKQIRRSAEGKIAP